MNFSATAKKENKKKAILKQDIATTTDKKDNCKYHSIIIPATNGMSNLIEGAFFQSGMFKGFDIALR